MKNIAKIELKSIPRISPSQFHSMKMCPYKYLLNEAYNKIPLLPVSANTYYGTVLHKMLDFITKGIIRHEDEFETKFQFEIRNMEEKLINEGYIFYVPLQRHVKDYTLKKILLKDHLRTEFGKQTKISNIKYSSEKWIESIDKKIGGKIDLIIESESETEIIDYKTGSILIDKMDGKEDDIPNVKEEYKNQLKIYAQLYYENNGHYPTVLSLVDLTKNKFNIPYSQNECVSLYDEAKELLKSTNESILNGNIVANPGEETCKYCNYRPGCAYYVKYLETENNSSDITGIIDKVVQYQNGNVTIHVLSNGRKFIVTSIDASKYDELMTKINDKINIFNLRKDKNNSVYSAMKTTMFYL